MFEAAWLAFGALSEATVFRISGAICLLLLAANLADKSTGLRPR
jgi:hypothetical protein